jgi:multiple sugar transport system ATP-binding protein
MTLGTRIVVLKDGVIQQVDSPQNLHDKPNNLFVAGFIGSPAMNFINAKVVRQDSSVVLTFGENEVKLSDARAKKIIDGGYEGKEVIIGIRPEDIHDEEVFLEASKDSVITANVEVHEFVGAEVFLYLIVNGQQLTARVNPRTKAKMGDTIKVALDVNRIHIFDKETELTIANF